MRMEINRTDTAIVITDPQNDVLKEEGLTWELVGPTIRTNKVVENLARLMSTGKERGYRLFISPHYYFPSDNTWQFGGSVENLMHDLNMFTRPGQLNLEGFSGSGADWLEQLAPSINDSTTVVSSPHKIYGPASNDMVLQLRKNNISKVILGGMLANLCVESHMRDFIEQGFQVAVVTDAVAAPNHPEWGDGNLSASINYRFIANAVYTTDQALEAMT
jgi:nicotinamidase-related amidase